MIQSVNEKRELQRKQMELESYENEMLRRYNEQQEGRQAEIQAKKAEAEAAREEIFQKLKEEEESEELRVNTLKIYEMSSICRSLKSRLELVKEKKSKSARR